MARGRDAVDVALTTSFGKTARVFTVWTDEVSEGVLYEPQAMGIPSPATTFS